MVTGLSDVNSLLIWLDALLPLMLLTSIWKENWFSRVVQSIAVGGAMGHAVLVGCSTIYATGVAPIITGSIISIVGLLFGISMFGRFTGHKWIARYGTQFVMAVGLGVAFSLTITTQIFSQSSATAENFLNLGIRMNAQSLINALIILVGSLTVLSFFFYTFPKFVLTQRAKGPYSVVRKIGRVYMMLAFGLLFAGEISFYLSVFIGRLLVFWKTALGF